MFNENHIIWFYIASQCIPPQHVEYSRLHNCHDRVKWKQTKGQNSHLLSSSLFSSLLAVLQIEGINVKSLRAFRVLRPLRLLSSIPSKSRKFKLLQKIIIDGNSLKFTVISNISTVEENISLYVVIKEARFYSNLVKIRLVDWLYH